MDVAEILLEVDMGYNISRGDCIKLAHELRVTRTALEMADKAHKEQMAELGRRQMRIDRLYATMRESVEQHDNGHSPCNCEEIKVALNDE